MHRCKLKCVSQRSFFFVEFPGHAPKSSKRTSQSSSFFVECCWTHPEKLKTYDSKFFLLRRMLLDAHLQTQSVHFKVLPSFDCWTHPEKLKAYGVRLKVLPSSLTLLDTTMNPPQASQATTVGVIPQEPEKTAKTKPAFCRSWQLFLLGTVYTHTVFDAARFR